MISPVIIIPKQNIHRTFLSLLKYMFVIMIFLAIHLSSKLIKFYWKINTFDKKY